MVKAIASATEIKNNFGRYLNMILEGNEVIVTKNGREVGRFIPNTNVISYLTDSLTGILSAELDIDSARSERLKEKYEMLD